MIATAKRRKKPAFPRAKIAGIVREVVPKNRDFKLHVSDSDIGNLKIVRIITPAWKTWRAWQRIGRVLDAMEGKLTAQEMKGILRFSVLTPEEYRDVVLNSPVTRARRVVKNGGAKKLAAKRKAGRKRKRTLAK